MKRSLTNYATILRFAKVTHSDMSPNKFQRLDYWSCFLLLKLVTKSNKSRLTFLSWLREALGKSVCLVFQFRKKRSCWPLSLEKYELRETFGLCSSVSRGYMWNWSDPSVSQSQKQKNGFKTNTFWLSLVVSQILWSATCNR